MEKIEGKNNILDVDQAIADINYEEQYALSQGNTDDERDLFENIRIQLREETSRPGITDEEKSKAIINAVTKAEFLSHGKQGM